MVVRDHRAYALHDDRSSLELGSDEVQQGVSLNVPSTRLYSIMCTLHVASVLIER